MSKWSIFANGLLTLLLGFLSSALADQAAGDSTQPVLTGWLFFSLPITFILFPGTFNILNSRSFFARLATLPAILLALAAAAFLLAEIRGYGTGDLRAIGTLFAEMAGLWIVYFFGAKLLQD